MSRYRDSLDKVRAPYNFVPLSDRVVFPAWRNLVSHDIPFADGISGSFDILVDCETPLIIRGEEDRGVYRPFEVDGEPVIPGTSLRGMLRNVVEIASFGKMNRVTDKKDGIRDLNNRHVYGRFMSEIQNRNPVPLVNAGWLTRRLDDDGEEVWEIQACHFAKIEYQLLMGLANEIGLQGYNPGIRGGAKAKYEKWGNEAKGVWKCPVRVYSPKGTKAATGIERLSDYGKVAGGGALQSGTLVFTGQPQNWKPGEKKKKHHDFFFYGDAEVTLPVSAEIRDAFEHVHRKSGQQGRTSYEPNEEWGIWEKDSRPRADGSAGERVPVFFLTHPDGKLRAFGLAMMFRLAYEMSPWDLVVQAQPDADSDEPDLAECMFGFVRGAGRHHAGEKSRQVALRGRVAVGMGRIEGKKPRLGAEVKAVLNAPRPTFYPNYVEQRDADGSTQIGGRPRGGNPIEWRTFMKERSARSHRPRGWKRVVARRTLDERPHVPAKASAKVTTRFRALEAPARFRATVRVHNIRPAELGALLWAIDFGGRGGTRHKIGQARALGFGTVRLRVDPDSVRLRTVAGADVALPDCVDRFRGWMESELEGAWEGSRQIFELVACATPPDDEEHLRHMRLDHPRYGNEFNAAKKQGLVLEPAGGETAWAEWRRTTQAAESLEDKHGQGMSFLPQQEFLDGSASSPVVPSPAPGSLDRLPPAPTVPVEATPASSPRVPQATETPSQVASALPPGVRKVRFKSPDRAGQLIQGRKKRESKARKKGKTASHKPRTMLLVTDTGGVFEAKTASTPGLIAVMEAQEASEFSVEFWVRVDEQDNVLGVALAANQL